MVAKSKPEELTPKDKPKDPSIAKPAEHDPGKTEQAPPQPGKLSMRPPGARARPRSRRTRRPAARPVAPPIRSVGRLHPAQGRRRDRAAAPRSGREDQGPERRSWRRPPAAGGRSQAVEGDPRARGRRRLGRSPEQIESGDETALSAKRWVRELLQPTQAPGRAELIPDGGGAAIPTAPTTGSRPGHRGAVSLNGRVTCRRSW
jgi:hypothetical protein